MLTSECRVLDGTERKFTLSYNLTSGKAGEFTLNKAVIIISKIWETFLDCPVDMLGAKNMRRICELAQTDIAKHIEELKKCVIDSEFRVRFNEAVSVNKPVIPIPIIYKEKTKDDLYDKNLIDNARLIEIRKEYEEKALAKLMSEIAELERSSTDEFSTKTADTTEEIQDIF
jgi:hypothetical protein